MSDYIIQTKNLTKKYGNNTVVDGVHINVRRGHVYGLLGRNGAGKTTIMKMLLGLSSISAGEVHLFGQPLNKNQSKLYPRIGSIVEIPGFYPNLTGTENLQIFARLRGTIKKDAVKRALETVDLPYNDSKKFAAYSLGMKQRLGIANALLNDPELLILDEPTNGLDPIGIAEIRAFIRSLSTEYGKTILISSHILSEIALMADDIGIIDKGVLLEESTMAELEKKNNKYIRVCVSSQSQAAHVLEHSLAISDYSVEADNSIRIYDTTVNPEELNKRLVTAGVGVSTIQICNDNLEEYFKKITGGAGIA
ncbi:MULTISPECIES: ABC transporter ATP-binding protein [Bacillaceae]|uniref:ABC transporter ATP-binding protein n=1 Tax=Bacillaceae TaxID=186817 RepID=UPI001E4D8E66|nr:MULTISPECIES: ABC transporter ATP-binding protein [Bacillaceae]MCE4048798.1 ABC transporter ATP-binding protein [Bacillus sp. Au-Bac7]UPO90693.1 ABC transporter ATP-binding protein [Niallia sp. Man26]